MLPSSRKRKSSVQSNIKNKDQKKNPEATANKFSINYIINEPSNEPEKNLEDRWVSVKTNKKKELSESSAKLVTDDFIQNEIAKKDSSTKLTSHLEKDSHKEINQPAIFNQSSTTKNTYSSTSRAESFINQPSQQSSSHIHTAKWYQTSRSRVPEKSTRQVESYFYQESSQPAITNQPLHPALEKLLESDISLHDVYSQFDAWGYNSKQKDRMLIREKYDLFYRSFRLKHAFLIKYLSHEQISYLAKPVYRFQKLDSVERNINKLKKLDYDDEQIRIVAQKCGNADLLDHLQNEIEKAEQMKQDKLVTANHHEFFRP